MRLWRVFLALVVALDLFGRAEAAPSPPADYPITNGHFYTQASGKPSSLEGFAITDEDGALFWHEFQRLGGVQTLGYPSSRRHDCAGFVCQATQRVILQWRADAGVVMFLNVFDDLSRAGFDPWLEVHRQVPPPADTAPDRGLPWPAVVRRHLDLLDRDPAIRQRYFEDDDPIGVFGLPMSFADFGPVSVVRAQRAVLQRWKVSMPWAPADTVTIANGGDLAKELGIIPAAAATPEDPPAAIATVADRQTRVRIAVPPPDVSRVAAAARPAVPQIYVWDAPTSKSGPVGFGSGIVVSADGYILTANHVITGAVEIQVLWPDGRWLPARVVATERDLDAAVIKVEATGLATLPLGNSDALQPGQSVVALGYGKLYPLLPNTKAGTIHTIDETVAGLGEVADYPLIQTTLPLQFGDSGGPLLDLRGNVVGLNSARALFRRRANQSIGLSIPINRLRRLLRMAEVPLGTELLHGSPFGLSEWSPASEPRQRFGFPES
ncbi:MAG: trypsin-like peptidase domain-containing protein [Chloroflexi bacterium]|nr:trypsin-like peptidase domain-containing protein [Chloroflexota bacterium]